MLPLLLACGARAPVPPAPAAPAADALASVPAAADAPAPSGAPAADPAPLPAVPLGPAGPLGPRVTPFALGDPGSVVSGDLDGDGVSDRAWLASARVPATGDDEEAQAYPERTLGVVVAEIGGRLLRSAPREGGSCSGEYLTSVAIADATGDGRAELVVTTGSYLCEVGDHVATFLVLAPRDGALAPLAEVTVPRWPQVGPFTTGRLMWAPGRVETTVYEDRCADTDGCLTRVVTTYRWKGDALVADAPRAEPVRTPDGLPVVGVTADGTPRVRFADGVRPVSRPLLPDEWANAALLGDRYDAIVRAP